MEISILLQAPEILESQKSWPLDMSLCVLWKRECIGNQSRSPSATELLWFLCESGGFMKLYHLIVVLRLTITCMDKRSCKSA